MKIKMNICTAYFFKVMPAIRYIDYYQVDSTRRPNSFIFSAINCIAF